MRLPPEGEMGRGFPPILYNSPQKPIRCASTSRIINPRGKLRKDASFALISAKTRNFDPNLTLPPRYLQDLYLLQAKYRRKDHIKKFKLKSSRYGTSLILLQFYKLLHGLSYTQSSYLTYVTDFIKTPFLQRYDQKYTFAKKNISPPVRKPKITKFR